MIINYSNKEKLFEKLNIHDAVFEGFSYSEKEKKLVLEMKNYCWGNEVRIEFCNVLVLNCEMCKYWGMIDSRMFGIELCEEEKLISNIQKENKDNDNYNSPYLKEENKYIEVKMVQVTGDIINIVCEYIDFQEKELNEDGKEDIIKEQKVSERR